MTAQVPLFPNNRPVTSADSVFEWVPGASANKIMPSGAKQLGGWLPSERSPAQSFNGLFGSLAEWVTFLDTMISDFDYSTHEKIALGYESTKDAAGNFVRGTAIGHQAGMRIDGDDSVFIGHSAGSDSLGDNITAVGFGAGLWSLGNVTAIGNSAGKNAVNAGGTFLGSGAGHALNSVSNTYGASWIAIGQNAGKISDVGITGISLGEKHIFIGNSAGINIEADTNSIIAIGDVAASGIQGGALSDSEFIVAIGTAALGSAYGGYGAVAIGRNSFKNETGLTTEIGASNIAVGDQAGIMEATATGQLGGGNTFIGQKAGSNFLASSGVTYTSNSVAIGTSAGRWGRGNNAVSIGNLAGSRTSSADASSATIGDSVIIGTSAGSAYAGVCTQNVFIGYLAGNTITAAIDNVGIGINTLEGFTSYNAVAIGNLAGANNVSAAGGGSVVVSGNDCVAIGSESGVRVSGNWNNAIGRLAGTDNSGSFCIAIGTGSLRDNPSDYQIAIGANSLKSSDAGEERIAIGSDAFGNLSTGNHNGANYVIAIGHKALYNTTAGATTLPDKSIYIGYRVGEDDAVSTYTLAGRFVVGQGPTADDELIHALMPTSANPNSGFFNLNAQFTPLQVTEGDRNLLAAVEGFMIFNTTAKTMDYYDGTVWKKIATV